MHFRLKLLANNSVIIHYYVSNFSIYNIKTTNLILHSFSLDIKSSDTKTQTTSRAKSKVELCHLGFLDN